MNANFFRFLSLFAAIGLAAIFANQSQADPLPGRDLLKFQQKPMIATPIVDTSGVLVGTYAGHDEMSTAYGFVNSAGTVTDYQGPFMADDFADNFTSPVVHVKWWGSYHGATAAAPQPPVQRFLVAFESDVPGPTPGFSHPGSVLQADILAKGALAPGSGTFTEKVVGGPDIFGDLIYEYNGELHIPRNFPEQANTVYWLKIAALVDVPAGTPTFPPNSPPPGITNWGWHNRDYTIKDTLASPLVLPGEFVDGVVGANNVYHFQDDAVTGFLRFTPGSGLGGIVQTSMAPTRYVGGADGPFTGQIPGQLGIDAHSKDLAFELYTTVPEPTTCLLLGCGLVGMAFTRRRCR